MGTFQQQQQKLTAYCRRLQVGICSAATKAGFEKVVNSVVGPARLAAMDVVMAGDDVKLKKPDPMIYNMAQQQIGIPKERFNTSLNPKPHTRTSNDLMLLQISITFNNNPIPKSPNIEIPCMIFQGVW